MSLVCPYSPRLIPISFAVSMKSLILATVTVLTFANLAIPATAGDANVLRQLRHRRACAGCDLSNADLQGMDLRHANLRGANLSHANLRNADLSSADLSHANLSGANLSGARLTQATLTAARLSQANLAGADLAQANLSQAQLWVTDLTAANLNGVNVQDADVKGTTLAMPAPTTVQPTTLPQSSGIQPLVAQQTEPNLDLQPSDPLPDPVPATVSAPSFLFESPLLNQQFQQPTALTLDEGVVTFNVTSRVFSLPDEVAGDNDAAVNFQLGFSWGISQDLELTLAYQQVDSSSPGALGPFIVNRANFGESTGNADITAALKRKLWQNADESLALSGLVSVSFAPDGRLNNFLSPGAPTLSFEDNTVVPALQFPFTASVGPARLTLSPSVAFFPESNAPFLFAPPTADAGTFGTTFGFVGAASVNVLPRLSLWGDAFIPVTGNNSLSPTTAQPTQEVAFNAGIRFLVNPRLGLDVFATNTQGSTGPLALTTQPDSLGLGANLIFLPDVVPGNWRYADSFDPARNRQDAPYTVDGLGFFDGGTVPRSKFLYHLQGGSQGILTALRYGFLKDFEGGLYLDYNPSSIDESEQGISGKVRLLNQAEGAPFTMSVAATLGQTNAPFLNFFNNDATAFEASGLERGFPFIGNIDDDTEGRLFLFTASLPFHYQVSDRANVWFTPTLAFVQQNGLDLGGFNLGGSLEVVRDFSVVAEIGANFFGEGNAFIGTSLADRIPWNVAVRWDPSRLFGRTTQSPSNAHPNVELFVTNRVGASTWHQLRVREQNEVAVGAGISFPF